MKIKDIVSERKLSKKEIKTRDKYADDLPDKEFKKRYGKDWEAVKYGTATKLAKKKKNEDAAGVGIVTKQNATADVPVGGEYMNVKKLFSNKKRKSKKK